MKELGIQETNPGACAGPDDWSKTQGRDLLEVITPIDGSVIARVALASAEDYEHVVKSAQENFLKWRMVPAPKRGQVTRAIAEELRALKEPLGKLVTLEMGKIVAEGTPEDVAGNLMSHTGKWLGRVL